MFDDHKSLTLHTDRRKTDDSKMCYCTEMHRAVITAECVTQLISHAIMYCICPLLLQSYLVVDLTQEQHHVTDVRTYKGITSQSFDFISYVRI